MLITIPKILREKLGEETAEGLIELLNNFSEHTHNSVISLAEEKFERRLAEETGKFHSELLEQNALLRGEVQKQIAGLRSVLHEDISELRSELFEKIERGQTSTIRWMFLFWIGQIGALLGILFAFFR